MCYFYKLIKTQRPLYLFNLIPPKLTQLLDTQFNLLPKSQEIALSFIKPTFSSLFSIHHPVGVKLLVRVRLGFSNLREHKFRHNFHNTLNPSCSCSLKPETTSHYLLCCHNFSSARLAFKNYFNLIDPTISQLNEHTSIRWFKEKCIEYYQIYNYHKTICWITTDEMLFVACK